LHTGDVVKIIYCNTGDSEGNAAINIYGINEDVSNAMCVMKSVEEVIPPKEYRIITIDGSQAKPHGKQKRICYIQVSINSGKDIVPTMWVNGISNGWEDFRITGI
jgi:hypothetical protein